MSEFKRLTVKQWKALDADGRRDPSILVIKGYSADSIQGAGERKFAVTVSTGAIDRDKDTIKVDGWALDTFRKNNVVLFAHKADEPPVAKAESIGISGGALKSTTTFPEPGVYAFADTIFGLVKGGFLKGISVGFHPEDFDANEARGGMDFKKQTLLEYSIVPIPANPEALIEVKSLGEVDLGPLEQWCERVLSTTKGPGLWLDKALVEKAITILRPTESVTVAAGTEFKAGDATVTKTPPWKIERRGEKFAVVGEEDGKVYGTHDSEGDAKAQMAALYANAKDGDAVIVKLVEEPAAPAPVEEKFVVEPEQIVESVKTALDDMRLRMVGSLPD